MSRVDRSRGLRDQNGRSTRSVASQTSQRISTARNLQESLNSHYARWSKHQRRGSLACTIVNITGRLLALYERVNRSMIDDFHQEDVLINRIGDADSPLFGSIMDIHPFSERDSWITIRNQVKGFCVRRRQVVTDEIPDPPIPVPPVPDPNPTPEPVTLPSEDELIRLIDRFFDHHGLEPRSFWSDGHDTRAFSRLSLIVINLRRVNTEQPLIVCPNFNTQANKNLARSTRYFYNRILRRYDVSREQIARRLDDAIRRGIPIWLERYQNTSNGQVLRRARRQLEQLNLCGDTFPVFEAQFNEPAPGHEWLGG